MRYNRRRRITDSGSAKSTQLLGLSLFIMLLAFFIVMNAKSSYDENKVNPIMGSLENTFSTSIREVFQTKPSIRPIEDEQGFRGDGEAEPTYDQIKNLFNGTIAGVSIRENRERGMMMIDVPFVELSTAILVMGQNSVNVGPNDLPFLPTLVSLLRSEDLRTPYRMDIILPLPEDPATLRQSDRVLFRAGRDKIGKLSRRLEAAGIPPAQLSIALEKGDDLKMVTLVFKPYQAINLLEESASAPVVEIEEEPDE